MTTERKAASNKKKRSKRDRMKEVVKNNWKPFAVGAGAVVGVIVLKRVIFPRYLYMCSGGSNFIMHQPRFWKSRVYHVTNMFGAPYNRLSRAVRCVETGQETLSIGQMAREMGLSQGNISQHLNYPDMRTHVNGYHFESIGYTLPNKGNWDLSSPVEFA